MKIIFHIGMGKTGTSSIQSALNAGSKELAQQKARYLGMWFDMVAPRYNGHEGLKAFCQAEPDVQRRNAAIFLEKLGEIASRDGVETFILSNEGLFSEGGSSLKTFIDEIRQKADVVIVAYMRAVREWLPSAFAQWGVRHKTYDGPIQSFRQRAPHLIKQYGGIRGWNENFGSDLVVRRHTKSTDVVADFAQTIGIDISSSQRRLERSEPADMILQALFNNRFKPGVFPERYRSMILQSDRKIESVEDMVEKCFNYDGIDEIIDGRQDLFDYVRNEIGMDLMSGSEGGGGDSKTVDMDALRNRIVDHLIEITFRQAIRIRKLEKRLDEADGN